MDETPSKAQLMAEALEVFRRLEGTAYADAAETMVRAATMLGDVMAHLEASLPDDWMKHNEAALYLKMSPDALYKLALSSDIPRHRVSGNVYRYNRKELDAWLRRR